MTASASASAGVMARCRTKPGGRRMVGTAPRVEAAAGATEWVVGDAWAPPGGRTGGARPGSYATRGPSEGVLGGDERVDGGDDERLAWGVVVGGVDSGRGCDVTGGKRSAGWARGGHLLDWRWQILSSQQTASAVAWRSLPSQALTLDTHPLFRLELILQSC